MDRSELAFRIEQAYRRCASFPEISAQNGTFSVRGDAFLAFIELRNLMPDVMLALTQGAQNCDTASDQNSLNWWNK